MTTPAQARARELRNALLAEWSRDGSLTAVEHIDNLIAQALATVAAEARAEEREAAWHVLAEIEEWAIPTERAAVDRLARIQNIVRREQALRQRAPDPGPEPEGS